MLVAGGAAGWAILACGASPAWKAVLALAAGHVAWLEWRYRPRPGTVRAAPDRLEITLRCGRTLDAQAPFMARVSPGYVAIRFPGRFGGSWLPLFADQLPPDAFRRLRQVLLHGRQ